MTSSAAAGDIVTAYRQWRDTPKGQQAVKELVAAYRKTRQKQRTRERANSFTPQGVTMMKKKKKKC